MHHTFRPFSLLHAIVLLAFVGCCSAAIAYGRSRRDTADLRRRERLAGWVILVLWVVVQTYTLMPRNFVAATALPLHVCDLASPIATIVLVWPHRRGARAMLYYWGIGLCTQAFFTPDLDEGPADLRFWAFWLPHACVVGAAIYDLGVRRYRPGWRDLRFACVFSLIYAIIVFTIDAMSGANYGYLGPSNPGQPSAIDAFGPWPARAPLLTALGQAVFVLMTIPFRPWRGRSP